MNNIFLLKMKIEDSIQKGITIRPIHKNVLKPKRRKRYYYFDQEQQIQVVYIVEFV
jgi:hypothetical protein